MWRTSGGSGMQRLAGAVAVSDRRRFATNGRLRRVIAAKIGKAGSRWGAAEAGLLDLVRAVGVGLGVV
jgi:hypothetical protein